MQFYRASVVVDIAILFVRPSVCLSVRPWRSGIRWKRLNISSVYSPNGSPIILVLPVADKPFGGPYANTKWGPVPGFKGVKNCPLNACKSVIKWHFVVLQMTMTNNYLQQSVFTILQFKTVTKSHHHHHHQSFIINLLAQKHDKVTRATKQIERDSKDTDANNSCPRKVQKLVRNTLQK